MALYGSEALYVRAWWFCPVPVPQKSCPVPGGPLYLFAVPGGPLHFFVVPSVPLSLLYFRAAMLDQGPVLHPGFAMKLAMGLTRTSGVRGIYGANNLLEPLHCMRGCFSSTCWHVQARSRMRPSEAEGFERVLRNIYIFFSRIKLQPQKEAHFYRKRRIFRQRSGLFRTADCLHQA